MSEVTSTILINQSNLRTKDIEKIITKKGFIFPVNDKWTAVVIQKGLKFNKECCEKLSSHLNNTGIVFEYNADYFCRISVYIKGDIKSYFEVHFEEDEILYKNLEELRDLATNPKKLQLFYQAIEQEGYYEALDLFKEAFEFNKVEWITYEYLNEWSSDDYLTWHIEMINQKKRRKKSLRDSIYSELNELLESNGFKLDSESDEENVSYSKMYRSFIYKLVFRKENKNQLYLGVSMPFRNEEISDELRIKKNVLLTLEYKNQKDLKTLLNTKVKEFIFQAYEFIKKYTIDIPKGSLYGEKSDPLFKAVNLNKIYVDHEIEQGGRAVFENDLYKVSFYHNKGRASIARVYILNKENNEEVELTDLVYCNTRYFGYSDIRYVTFSFSNFMQFQSILEKILSFYQQYINEKEYIFKR
ncbi:hypothetical protein [Gottfriedia solisilvae]|uniref:Uncharacterized protein n=1 Tax=Gottfriedia solisilvae TaxID=1516104 RepID=A0A8J3EWL9_9BACI|nr:hypothetical protein [Gottfriedia solisilvae]GGI11506.1 hypothetical protein GCM10007380_08180 [Gottfriedia solisilvae]